jgi:hypothetical protein
MKLYEQQVFLFDKVHWQPLFLPYNFWRMMYIKDLKYYFWNYSFHIMAYDMFLMPSYNFL